MGVCRDVLLILLFTFIKRQTRLAGLGRGWLQTERPQAPALQNSPEIRQPRLLFPSGVSSHEGCCSRMAN